jgi:hypothetical protein
MNETAEKASWELLADFLGYELVRIDRDDGSPTSGATMRPSGWIDCLFQARGERHAYARQITVAPDGALMKTPLGGMGDVIERHATTRSNRVPLETAGARP